MTSALIAPTVAFCSLSDEVDASDPRGWTYQLDPGLGVKGGILFTPSSTSNGSDVQSVGGPAASLRFIVFDGSGTIFTEVDTQAAILLNTPVTLATLLGAGASAGYHFRGPNIRLWFGLSYEGFLNFRNVGGAVARIGASKSIIDGIDLELEATFFYANQSVSAGTVNYELPAIDFFLSFPFSVFQSDSDKR
jgi:hypothetical protein